MNGSFGQLLHMPNIVSQVTLSKTRENSLCTQPENTIPEPHVFLLLFELLTVSFEEQVMSKVAQKKVYFLGLDVEPNIVPFVSVQQVQKRILKRSEGILSLLWDHLYPCFGLLVMSAPSFKARVDPVSCVFLIFTSGV